MFTYKLYKLTTTVTNPKPDRRYRDRKWSAMPEVAPGYFVLFVEDADADGRTWPYALGQLYDYTHEAIPLRSDLAKSMLPHLVEVPEEPAPGDLADLRARVRFEMQGREAGRISETIVDTVTQLVLAGKVSTPDLHAAYQAGVEAATKED